MFAVMSVYPYSKWRKLGVLKIATDDWQRFNVLIWNGNGKTICKVICKMLNESWLLKKRFTIDFWCDRSDFTCKIPCFAMKFKVGNTDILSYLN